MTTVLHRLRTNNSYRSLCVGKREMTSEMTKLEKKWLGTVASLIPSAIGECRLPMVFCFRHDAYFRSYK